uniref:Uncharacterized protein n=1 Tax=mine drainage metagenome TaxID=410659 RepID=E6QBC9_9ZZZZ
MPTPSYLIAQQIIPKVKAQCPRIVIPAGDAPGTGKNSFTFFAGSAYEQTVQFRQMMAHANPFWEPLDHEPMVRDWNTRIHAAWLSNTYNKILLNEIYAVMGIQKGTRRHDLDDDLPEITGRALQVAKARIWGIPVRSRSEAWFFHRLITAGCAKKTVPEAVWKLACINVGSLYGVNENVLMDAILEQKTYRSLYAIHPLLGRSWVPWIRRFVEQSMNEQVDHSRYAKQLPSALSAHGIHKSGVKTLHRMAESSPMTFRNVMRRIVENAAEASEETIAMLNLLNGRKPSSGVTFKRIIEKTSDNHEAPARHPEDILVMAKIDQWLAKDMRFDRGLVHDWMRFLTRERRGSLHRGYLDVTKNIQSPAKRKEAALAWANRSQQYWHRHRPRQAENIFYQATHRSLSWKPIVAAVTSLQGGVGACCSLQVLQGGCTMQGWQFVELTSSEALREEGDAMQHCVAGYDGDCHRGRSHIFSVRDAKGSRVSTLELCQKQKTRKGIPQYVIAQNRGVQNATVSASCRKAAEQFLKVVNDFLKVNAGCKPAGCTPANKAPLALKECA